MVNDKRHGESADQVGVDPNGTPKDDATTPDPENSATEASEPQEALDREQEAIDRRQAKLDRDQAQLENAGLDPANLLRKQKAIDREQLALDRQQARLDRAQGALDRESGVRKDYLIDELTGILRRGPGMRELQHEMDRARRQGLALVVAFIDVDGLKAVNDRQGHAAGDQVLRAVSEALAQGLRSYDLLFRYGGDEFVCALSGADMEHATERLRAVAETLGAGPTEASIAWGLAEMRENDDLDDFVGRADSALYEGRDATSEDPSR